MEPTIIEVGWADWVLAILVFVVFLIMYIILGREIERKRGGKNQSYLKAALQSTFAI
jgi:hypothetical protein